MAKVSTNSTSQKVNPFGDLKGEKFGGGSNYLQLQENEIVNGLVHVKVEKNVELDKSNAPVDLHVAIHPDSGEEIRMPASAVFRINAEKAGLKTGDVYSVARLADTLKKSGKGKNRPMQVYSILVTGRKKQKA